MNEHVRGLGEQYRTLQDKMQNVKDKLKENDVTDSSPLVKIKSALARLEKEMADMDVRTGILNQNWVQTQLK